MGMRGFLKLIATLSSATALVGIVIAVTSGAQAAAPSSPDPVGDSGLVAAPTEAQAVLARSAPIIVDHTCTDLSKVPPYWIEQAKKLLWLSYGHTSHGSQLVSGMGVLMADPANNHLYDYNTNGAIVSGVLSLHDQMPSGDLGNPDRLSWYTRTRDYLNSGTGTGKTRNVVVWSWCGQADTTPQNITTYLSLMSLLETQYPTVTLVHMTGHLVGSGEAGNLNQRNNQIRAYVQAHNGVLFDFADIESYDPSGNYFLNLGANDNCDYSGGNWATQWCNAHPGDPLCRSCGCAHSQPLNCNLKARAFWWLLARIAGWPGPGESQKTASAITPTYGQSVTYTIVVQNLSAPVTATVCLTDTLPSGTVYIPGTLTATQGTVSPAAPGLYWTGSISDVRAVTITYAVTVTAAVPTAISNTATIVAPGYQTLNVTATIIANGYSVYLPLVLKQ
jgi:uncharacterized repeat protein (TIGR01451 family)